MSIHDFKFCSIDFEASSLNRDTYPIEIGWCYVGQQRSQSMIIQPHKDWGTNGWSSESEKIHGLAYNDLLVSGKPISNVIETLEKAFDGYILLSDAVSYENMWMHTLFQKGKDTHHRFQIKDMSYALSQIIIKHAQDTQTTDKMDHYVQQANTFTNMGESAIITPHRAGPDAAYNALLLEGFATFLKNNGVTNQMPTYIDWIIKSMQREMNLIGKELEIQPEFIMGFK